MNHADALADGVRRRRDAHRATVDADLALVWLLHPVQDLHERGFSGAIFAKQSQDLPALNVEVDVIVRQDARKLLDDAVARPAE
jgi:hypothetical protein